MKTGTKDKPALLEKVVATIGELPTSPSVVSAVMGMTADLNTDVDQLSRVLSADQALTAKVLRLSNSPFYGRAKEVGSLSEAVLILGFYTIRSLVVATATHSLFKKNKASENETTLWEHSLACALTSRMIARRSRMPRVEETFVAGLLHDIGQLVLMQKLPEQYEQVIERVRENDHLFYEVEHEMLGFDHAELGAVILQEWNFPAHLIESLRFHEEPERATSSDDTAPLACLIHVADMIVNVQGYGFHKNLVIDPASLESAAKLNLTPDDIADISEKLDQSYAEEKRLFEG